MNALPPSGFPNTTPIEVVAWENRELGFFARLTGQMEALSIRPVAAGRAFRSVSGPLGPALSFSSLSTAIAYLPLALCLPCMLLMLPILAASEIPPQLAALQGGMVCAVVAGMPFFLLGIHLASDAIFGVTFHALARLAGGTGSLRDSLRVAFYARGTTAWMLLVWFLAWIPFVGTVLQIGFRALLLLWSALTFFGAAEGVHGLGEDRAILVAIGTAVLGLIVLVTIGAAIGALVVVIAFGSFASLAAALPHLPSP